MGRVLRHTSRKARSMTLVVRTLIQWAGGTAARHFGETFDISGMSIVGVIGRACETLADAFAQLNRYARLVAEVDLGTADRLLLERSTEGLWIVDSRKLPNDFPELTESTFARMVCTSPVRQETVRENGPCHTLGAGLSR